MGVRQITPSSEIASKLPKCYKTRKVDSPRIGRRNDATP